MTTTDVATTINVGAGIDAVWEMITARSEMHRWWGLLDHDIDCVAKQVTVQTGSCSFYRLWIDRLEAPRLLEFKSAYLGVTPTDTVRCELEEIDNAAVRFRLTATVDGVDLASVQLTDELWRRRLTRMKYALRHVIIPDVPPDIRCSSELSSPTWRPLHSSNVCRWLPVAGPTVPPRWFFIIDSDGPRAFPVTAWHAHYDDRLGLGIAVAPTGPATRADISIGVCGGAVQLAVRHSGWDRLEIDSEMRQVLFFRFQATWRHAIDLATKGSTTQ